MNVSYIFKTIINLDHCVEHFEHDRFMHFTLSVCKIGKYDKAFTSVCNLFDAHITCLTILPRTGGP